MSACMCRLEHGMTLVFHAVSDLDKASELLEAARPTAPFDYYVGVGNVQVACPGDGRCYLVARHLDALVWSALNAYRALRDLAL